MKTYYATITVLAMTLLPSICTLAQEGSVAVPGTADAPLPSGMSPQAERQAIKTEMAKVPLGPIMGMHAPDRDSEGITITSAGFTSRTGNPRGISEPSASAAAPSPHPSSRPQCGPISPSTQLQK